MQLNEKASLGVWRNTEWQQVKRTAVSSGYGELDESLADGGWLEGSVTDVLYDDIGALKLLLPTLAQLSQQQERWVLWVAPPVMPSAQVLQNAGVDLSRVLIVREESVVNRLDTIERALLGGGCSAVLAWPGVVGEGVLKRFRCAVQKSESLCFLFHDTDSAKQSESALLRVKLTTDRDGVGVEFVEEQEGWRVRRLVVPTDCVHFSGTSSCSRKGAEIIRGPWAG